MTTAYPLPKWRRSKSCSGGQCVEVAKTSQGVLVRDSKDPDGPALRFPTGAWTAFMDAVKGGEFHR